MAAAPVRVGLCGGTMAMSACVGRFPLVETQHTFYDPPSDAVLSRWRTSAPAGFEFTIKAWQLVTHEPISPTMRKLKRPVPPDVRAQLGAFRTTDAVLQAWDRTLGCARRLDATVVLMQCPPSFRPTEANVARFRAFLCVAPRPAGRMLWEPRGAWPDALLAELCHEFGLVHVVDPMQRETVTPSQTYYRLHGTTGSHVHTDAELRQVRDRIVDRPCPYVLFDNLPRVGDAERFLDLL